MTQTKFVTRALCQALSELRMVREIARELNLENQRIKTQIIDLEKYTVRIGVERGRFREPAIGLNLVIRPYEFRYAHFGSNIRNISYEAERIGHAAGNKIASALVKFFETGGI